MPLPPAQLACPECNPQRDPAGPKARRHCESVGCRYFCCPACGKTRMVVARTQKGLLLETTRWHWLALPRKHDTDPKRLYEWVVLTPPDALL